MIEIGGLQKTTLIDYPGRVAATVFLVNCNFRCPFCYSSELVIPEKIKKQPRIPLKEFFSFLRERAGLLDGVVICGGEPCLNQELPQFIKKIKKLGYLVKLDTNGSNPSLLKKLIEEKLIDYIAMDIKAPLNKKKYSGAIGREIDINLIKESIKLIKDSGIEYEFRTTVVPGIHSKEDIIEIAKQLRPARKYFLQNFRPEKTNDPKFEKIRPYSKEKMSGMRQSCSKYIKACFLRE